MIHQFEILVVHLLEYKELSVTINRTEIFVPSHYLCRYLSDMKGETHELLCYIVILIDLLSDIIVGERNHSFHLAFFMETNISMILTLPTAALISAELILKFYHNQLHDQPSTGFCPSNIGPIIQNIHRCIIKS
jgi:hypothetical protein